MLPRISNAVGFCDKGSSIDYVLEGCNWLPTSVEVAPFFVVPVPTLQNILQLIGISRCQTTGQFYLSKFPFLASNNHLFNSDTPWGIAYSAQKRCRYLEMFLNSRLQLCQRLIDELHHLAVVLDTNITNNLSTFISLLCPLLTGTPDSEVDIPNDDVLVLFGFPASAFQILLFTPCLCSVLTNLVLELVANRSPYSEHLLDQFRQPIGLCALFSSKQTFCDISSRLTDLFQISEEPRVQAKILGILPDLASSLCPSGCILTDEDRSLLVLQLITLLDNISLEHQRSSSKDCSAIICLIECLTSFSVKGEVMNQLHSAFFNLLNRCSGYDFFFEYLPVIIRCLLINGAAVPQTSSELSNLVTRLRTFVTFAKSGSINSAALINSTLVGLLRVAFLYNRNIISAWVRVIDFDCQTSDSASQISKDYRSQNHFVHDFIVLCIALSTLTVTDFKSGSDTNVLSDRSSGEVFRSSDLDHYKRLKSEVLSLVRRLLTTGRLFSFSKIHDDIDTFLADYGELLFSGHTRLFPSFLLILNQLITSSGLGSGRLKSVTRYIALSLHMKMFTNCMSDQSQKQEIISHLVNYSLTGIDNLVAGCADRFKVEAIINDILITLIRLAQSSPRELGMFETNLITLRNKIDFTALSFDSKQTNPEHCIMVKEHYLGYLHRKEHVKYIFSILAYTAFGIKDHRKHQDSLLSFIRKLLSSQSLFSKCLGIIGAVVIIEVICRKDSPLKDVEYNSVVATSGDDNIAIFSSQFIRKDSDQINVSTTNTSRSSNTSSLSLKAPDTAVADGFSDIHLLADDNGEDKNVNCLSHSSDLITPPSHLLLQLVGFVEHSVRSHCQLMVFWLDELSFCFNRIMQLSSENSTNQSKLDLASNSELHLCEQGKNLMIWMGARIMHAFQDYFIQDNASIQNYSPHFPLHKSSLCEIAIALGPSWDKFSDYQKLWGTLENPSTSSPLLLPAYLNLVAIAEADQHNRSLDTIDALLGCPLLMPDIFDGGYLTQLIIKDKKISTSKPHLIIGTINWFVEAVNVFSPTLLFANPLNSQNFQQISPSNMFNSKRIHYLSILLRLIQIAKLRDCLCDYVKMVIHTKDCLLTGNVEGVHNQELQSQSHRVPTHDKNNVYLSNLILPTATYQPEMPFSHPFVSYNKHPNQQCFNYGGINLQSFLFSNTNCSSCHQGSRSYSKLGAYSKGKMSCVSDFCLIKRRKVAHNAIEIRQDDINEVTDVAVSQSESSTIQLTGLQQISKEYDKKFLTDKLFTVTKHTSKTSIESDKFCLMTNLPELATCFRELDLSAIVLGLSSWPWIVKCSENEVLNVDSSIDWITLTWLLGELSIRLDHVIGIPLSSCGWNGFERFDNLTESSKLAYFAYIVPSLINVLVRTMGYISGMINPNTYLEGNFREVIHSFESSDNESYLQYITASKVPQSNTSASIESDLYDNKFVGSLPGVTVHQISSVVCICLRSLLILVNGLTNPSSNIEQYLFDNPNSLVVASMTMFTYNTLNTLAKCCKSNVNISPAREIVVNKEGIIKPDLYKPVTCGYDLEQNTLLTKRMDEVNRKFFVDIYDEHYELRPVFQQINDAPIIDYRTLSQNLRTIIEYLMKNLTASYLPTANAALLHCRLVFYLSSLYYECQNNLRVSYGLDENKFWVPDLFSYTRDLLDQQWDTSIKWKGQTYPECLQSILSFHFRSHFYRSKEHCSLSESTSLLMDFTKGILVTAVHHYQCINEPLTSCGIPNILRSSYRTLNQQTVHIFCREVMESVLWISKQLCDLLRCMNDPVTSFRLDESSIVAQWNQCVEVMCCIINFFRKPEQLVEPNSKSCNTLLYNKHNMLIHILPSTMRSGRLFLHTLLKGAMPLLNNLFRSRGIEVTTFLKNIQQLTRFLQRICNHAKAYRSPQLTNQIPATRRCLETFVYKVKIMLSQNHCFEAFWLGTLRCLDLHGSEVLVDNHSIENGTAYSDVLYSATHSKSSRIRSNRDSMSHWLANPSASTSSQITNNGMVIESNIVISSSTGRDSVDDSLVNKEISKDAVDHNNCSKNGGFLDAAGEQY
ncbi:hypothetical protein MN116_001325 [Schistosoma mekongi]|uniref:Fanconi anemia group D2 protein n=1 Tax=Schistosoma mekongi TaxID=38744 RepID=A0AAE1ZLB8_SCHME|nr:hypothetical protein MN116_001325 [Schistosoma mekongi]